MRPGQLEAWLITLAVEMSVAVLLALAVRGDPRRFAASAGLGSLISHPLVWAMFFPLMRWGGYWSAFAIAESFAVLSESILYALIARQTWPRALAFSFLVNAASVAAGFIRHALW